MFTSSQNILVGGFSLLILAAGWYYLFYSPAARNLAGIENPRRNALRIRLRRINGLLMMLLAISFYGALRAIDRQQASPMMAVWVFAVPLLLMAILVLALVDLRLTQRMRDDRRNRRPPS